MKMVILDQNYFFLIDQSKYMYIVGTKKKYKFEKVLFSYTYFD